MLILHKIENIRFEGEYLIVTVDNKDVSTFLREVSPRLKEASSEVRNDFAISPSGYGIHWRQLDEDFSIKGLIEKSLQDRV